MLALWQVLVVTCLFTTLLYMPLCHPEKNLLYFFAQPAIMLMNFHIEKEKNLLRLLVSSYTLEGGSTL